MSVYTVHEPPLRGGQTAPDPERFVFVRDGFYFWAFLLGPFWMIWRRLWLVLTLYVVFVLAVEGALRILGVPGALQFTVNVLIALLVGFEAGTLRRWTLTRRRWRQVGVVVGDDLEAAEHRFFAAWAERREPPPTTLPPAPISPVRAIPTTPVSTAPPQPPAASGIIGLFPQPGGRP